jgi:Protein of unknown function (DUF3106)
MVRRITVLAVLLAAFAVTVLPQPRPKFKGPGFGGPKGPVGIRPEAFEKFRRLTPEERKAALNNLPPQRREIMERRLEEWEKMTPEERQRVEGSYARFQEMTPERQQEVRLLYRRFSETFPAERRPQAQMTIRRLKGADPEERKRILESKRYQQSFSEDERKLIEQMVNELPDRH